MPRITMTRLRAAAATALLSLTLAAPAFAGHDDWDDDHGDRRGYPVHRHDRSCDHDDWDRGRGRGYYEGRGYHDWRGYRGQRGYYGDRGHRYRDEYGCRPCGRRWSRRDAFHRHLTHSHHVPLWALPRVVVQVDWGWVFRG